MGNGRILYRILYWKMDEFQKDRPLNLQDRFITEAWLAQDEEGRLGSTVGISGDLEGNVVIYWYYANGQATTVYLGSEEEDIVQAISPDVMVQDWLDGIWGRVQSGFGRDGESESRKVVDGKETVVFEWQHVRDEDRPEHGQLKRRIEMVINDPLLVRELTYEVDESGAETLVLDFAVTEYRLLPAGSEIPDAP